MSKKIKSAIFNLNNILLSAFGLNASLSESLIKENNKLEKDVSQKLVKTYKMLLKGEKVEQIEEETPELLNALINLKEQKYAVAFYDFVRSLKDNPDNIELIKSISLCLLNLKAYNVILKHFEDKLLQYISEDNEVLNIVASTYFGIPEHYKDAIPLYEKLLKTVPFDNRGYNYKLAFLLERVYQDKKLDEQIAYAKKALELTPDKNLVNTFLAKLYYRAGNIEECTKCCNSVINNNPTPEEVVSCSRFLMKEGRIAEAYGMYRCRFETGNVTYPKLLLPEKRWDGKKDISKSTVIVHYEQGFGDSVMFSRYIPRIASMAGKVIFVVQKNLIPIFKSSGFDRYCEILSHEADINPNIKLKDTNRSVMYSTGKGMGKIPHDFHIPLMDTPYLMNESPDKMLEANGYLMASPEKVEEFRKKYIRNNNHLKIGLAYHGTKQSILTYRDISIKKFLPLLKMKGIDFYSFQSDEYAKELSELSKDITIYDLGKEFKNFEDTACAMTCMDLIISTDNVVMNLAGALGIKTYCLFNVFSESRWYKTEGNDVGWYKSVKPFRAKTFNDWDNLMLEVKNQLVKDFNL